MELHGQSFLIFGGTSGIGLGTATAALQAGASVVVVGRSAERLDAALRALGEPARVRGIMADVGHEGDVARVFEQAGGVDHVISTAVTPVYAPVRDFDAAAAQRTIASKLLSSFLIAKHGAARLRAGGSITFVSGIAAERPMPCGSVIAAVNGALHSAVRAFALELAPVRVNAVSPGWVDTPVWDAVAGGRKPALHAQMAQRLPVGRIGTPADIAVALLFVTQNSFTTGAVLCVDGGHRLV